MKLLVAAVAVAVALASPALAKSKKKKKGVSSHGVYRVVHYRGGSLYTSRNVYGPGGRYVGSDPDFRVRLEMHKDAWTRRR
jgi:hypothetical protein